MRRLHQITAHIYTEHEGKITLKWKNSIFTTEGLAMPGRH